MVADADCWRSAAGTDWAHADGGVDGQGLGQTTKGAEMVTEVELSQAADQARRVMELGEMMLRTAIDERSPADERAIEVERLAHVIKSRLRDVERVIW